MFTVKFVAPSGAENIRECKAVIADRTEHDGRPRVLVFNEVPHLDHCNHDGIYVRQEGDSSDDVLPHKGMVYVMNRFGATVATYRL